MPGRGRLVATAFLLNRGLARQRCADFSAHGPWPRTGRCSPPDHEFFPKPVGRTDDTGPIYGGFADSALAS